MKHFFALSLLAVFLYGCGPFDSPVLTPKPGDYPCHHEDGSAAPDRVWCYPVDGSHTCCWENFACVPGGCDFQGDPNWAQEKFGAVRKHTERLPE